MEKYSKFIIENGNLILAKVTFHKEIVKDASKVKGGGWFRYVHDTKTFVFFGDSTDFGEAKLEDIKTCVKDGKIYSDNRLYRNLTEKYNFSYDTGSEVIELEKNN